MYILYRYINTILYTPSSYCAKIAYPIYVNNDIGWIPELKAHIDFSCIHIYLIYIPGYEKPIIFGAKWLRTEWNPSRQLVCAKGDTCWVPSISLLFNIAFFALSYTTDSEIQCKVYQSHILWKRSVTAIYCFY